MRSVLPSSHPDFQLIHSSLVEDTNMRPSSPNAGIPMLVYGRFWEPMGRDIDGQDRQYRRPELKVGKDNLILNLTNKPYMRP